MSEIKQILEALTSADTENVKELAKALKDLAEVQTDLGISYRELGRAGKDVTRALEAGETSASNFADRAFGLGEKIGSLGGLFKENENGLMANAKGFLEMATGGENAAASMANLTAGFKSAINPAKLLTAAAELTIEAMIALSFATDLVFTKFINFFESNIRHNLACIKRKNIAIFYFFIYKIWPRESFIIW